MLQAISNYPITTTAIVIVGFIIHWLWTNVISDKIAEIGKRRIDKAIADTRKLDKLYEANRYQLHNEMQELLRECSAKGYRSTHSTSQFGFIYSTYKELGGNHDGDILLNDFEKIPLRDTLIMPIDNGDEIKMSKDKYEYVYNNTYKEKG